MISSCGFAVTNLRGWIPRENGQVTCPRSGLEAETRTQFPAQSLSHWILLSICIENLTLTIRVEVSELSTQLQTSVAISRRDMEFS